MSSWNCSAVLDGQLYTHSRRHWPSTSAFCHSAEVGRTALSTEQFRSSVLFCGGPVDLEFAARQSSWPITESRYFQTSAEDIHFCEILMTKCVKRIRDLFEHVLYKFTLYLLTYLRCMIIYRQLWPSSLEAKPPNFCLETGQQYQKHTWERGGSDLNGGQRYSWHWRWRLLSLFLLLPLLLALLLALLLLLLLLYRLGGRGLSGRCLHGQRSVQLAAVIGYQSRRRLQTEPITIQKHGPNPKTHKQLKMCTK